MITIEDMEIILEEVANELPQEFYKELNGGILLLPELKVSDDAINDDLYIMGEYHTHYSMGRYITIYYGSFQAMYGHASLEAVKEELRHTLRHEFTHHLESLAGEKDLELKDAKNLEKYRNKEPMDKI